MPDLNISLDKLGWIIERAREFDAEEGAVDEDSGSNPSDDREIDVLQMSEDNPAAHEIREAVRALNVDERVELLALTWLGRGDYAKEEWQEALRDARHAVSKREADYLIGTPLLADYLEEALETLGIASVDVKNAEM